MSIWYRWLVQAIGTKKAAGLIIIQKCLGVLVVWDPSGLRYDVIKPLLTIYPSAKG